MSDIPDDIMKAGRLEAEFYGRWLRAGNSTGSLSPHAIDGLADSFSRLIFAERQRYDSLKALCDEMAKEARRQALEEAADLADNYGDTYSVCRSIARSIRALSKSSPNPLPEQIANISKEGG